MRAMLAVALAVGAVGIAGAAATPSGSTPSSVPMTVRTVTVYQGQNVVLLEGGDPKVVLPIWIGSIEANAIDMRLRGQKAPRPLTHDLLESTLAALGAKVERVEVIDLRDTVYIGRLTIRDAAGTLHTIDARPSDLCSLAVGANLPMYVNPNVLKEAAIKP